MLIANNRVLVIKLSPVKGLNSSTLRALSVVKGLVDEGYIVDMLTLQASATHVLNENEYDFLDNVNIVFANPNKMYNSLVIGANKGFKQIVVSCLRKVFHTFSIFDYTHSIAKGIKLSILPSKEYEYVVAISDPKTTHIATKNLVKQGLRSNKIIEYWGDPLYGDITLKSIYPGFVYKRIEKNLLAIADRIVYTSPFTLAQEQKLYPMFAERMIYTPTAYLEEKYFPKREGRFTIGYYGAYPSNVRNILPLYNACKRLNGIAELIIVGNSDLTLEETDNIKIKPRGDIREYEKKTNLFVCVLNKSGTQIPGKLYHYAAYNKAVLVLEDGEFAEEMHKFILSFNRYYTCKNDAGKIEECIKDIIVNHEEWSPCELMAPKNVIKNILG